MKSRIISIFLVTVMCILMLSGMIVNASEEPDPAEEPALTESEDPGEDTGLIEETDAEEGDSEDAESAEGESAEGESAEGESAEGTGPVEEPDFGDIDPSDPDFEGFQEMDSAGDSAGEADGNPECVQAFIVVRGFEWGPGVNKVVLEFDEPIDGISADRKVHVITMNTARTVLDTYLSNRMGYAVEGSSRYITFDLETDYDHSGSPFIYALFGDQHNYWAREYVVSISVYVELGGETFKIRFEEDCIDNHFSPDVVAFSDTGSFSGEYFNILRGQTDTLTLNYAIYEPEKLAGGEKNPLLIWLHGRGEGGDDIEITLLGYEVSALTEPAIQSHFISGDQIGCYVLVPQTPTYWRDAGDSVEHEGDMPSRYQYLLKDLIDSYIEGNPDVDTDRIYIMGASNGGFMTLEMCEHYPDFFAAAVPISPATSYYVYAREDDGSYRKVQGQYVKTGDVYFTEEKINILKNIPMWFIGAATDTITPPLDYSLPCYQALIQSGAENYWITMYQGVKGTDSSTTNYLGHWAWVYLLNDQVCYVQDNELVKEADEDTFYFGVTPSKDGGTLKVPDGNGGYYENLFDWLNDQSKAN